MGQDELENMWHRLILFYAGSEVLCDDKTSARKIWEILKRKYLTKSIENRLHLKMRLYHFQLKKEIFISEHMNNYTKLLPDVDNVHEVIKD